MFGQFRLACRCLVAAAFLLLACGRLLAQADIDNGLVRLGITPFASLGLNPAVNAPTTSAAPGSKLWASLRYVPTNGEADCGAFRGEEWGVADALTAQFGGSFAGGNTNLVPVSFTSTPNSAVATVTATALGVFQVTHDFHPSTHPNVYEITLTIKNNSGAAVNVQYRRGFEWDINPTNGNEILTLQGSVQPGVLSLTNKGSPGIVNPLTAPTGVAGGVFKHGPADAGFPLTMDLGPLAPGATTVNRLYYGACADRASAVTA